MIFMQGHKFFESMPPLPEGGPMLNNDPIAADSDDEVTSIPTAHTPEAEEGESGDRPTDYPRKQGRETEEDTADSGEKLGEGRQDVTEAST